MWVPVDIGKQVRTLRPKQACTNPRRGWREAVSLVGLLAIWRSGEGMALRVRFSLVEGRWWRLGRRVGEKRGDCYLGRGCR